MLTWFDVVLWQVASWHDKYIKAPNSNMTINLGEWGGSKEIGIYNMKQRNDCILLYNVEPACAKNTPVHILKPDKSQGQSVTSMVEESETRLLCAIKTFLNTWAYHRNPDNTYQQLKRVYHDCSGVHLENWIPSNTVYSGTFPTLCMRSFASTSDDIDGFPIDNISSA
jgi:hypothetical protein